MEGEIDSVVVLSFFPNLCLKPSTELWNFLFKEVHISPFPFWFDTGRWLQWTELTWVFYLDPASCTEAKGRARNMVQFYSLLVIAVPRVPSCWTSQEKKLLIRNSLNFPPCPPAFVFIFHCLYSQSSSPITEKSGQGYYFSGLSLSALEGETKNSQIPLPRYCVKIFICLNWTYQWLESYMLT